MSRACGRGRHTAPLVLAAVVALNACSGGGGHRSKVAPLPASTTTTTMPRGMPLGASAWATSNLHLISAAGAAGGRFLAYGATAAALTLYGIDAATGQVAWSQPASPSNTTQGVPLVVATFGDAVAYFRPDASEALAARLVLADAATGKDRWASAAGLFGGAPRDCGDHVSVCAPVATATGAVLRAYALDKGTARSVALQDGARDLGSQLYDFGGRTPEKFGVVSGSGVVWSQPVTGVFGPGSSTDNGWDFQYYRAQAVYTGTVGHTAPAGTLTEDVTTMGTAGIDAATGRRRWFVPNSSVGCNGVLDIYPTHDTDGSLPVRCRYAGKATTDVAGTTTTLSGPTTVTGFDVETGAATWNWHTNADPRLFSSDKPIVQVDDFSVVLPDPAGHPFVVDLRTGASVAASAATVGWCATLPTYTFGPASQGPDSNQYQGGPSIAPCRADGSAAASAPLVPDTYVATVGGIVAFTSNERLVATHRG